MHILVREPDQRAGVCGWEAYDAPRWILPHRMGRKLSPARGPCSGKYKIGRSQGIRAQGFELLEAREKRAPAG